VRRQGVERHRPGRHQFARPLAECGPLELWRGRLHLAVTELAQVKALTEEAEQKHGELAKTDQGMQILDSIPRVGPRTAEAVVAFLPEPQRFRTTKQVSPYGGFVPRQYQSTDTADRGRITRHGPKVLRAALVECAWCSLRYNPWARATWLRLQANGLSKKKAIVALARKLLVRCWAILHTGRPGPADAAG